MGFSISRPPSSRPSRFPPSPPERLLLCTDLDRTLLPNGHQPESEGARSLFARLVQRPQVTLAYVSGRDPALVAEAIGLYSLPEPAWVVADVGTSILEVTAHGWRRLPSWDETIGLDWSGRGAEDLLPLLAGVPGLTLQEPGRQSRHKLSFYLPLDQDGPRVQADLQARLTRAGVSASVIHSIDEAARVALVDVLPASATKLHAVRFLMDQLGFDRRDTLFAGDSGNDLPVLESDLRSILVANADPALIARLGLSDEHPVADGPATAGAGSTYLARGNFMGMNGNYSAGIVEGVVHHHPGTASWLEASPPPPTPPIPAPALTHLNERGEVRMVEVGDRPATARSATAEGFIRLEPAVLQAVVEGRTPKGDVLAVARVAAIQAAKRTAELIPLCHPLPLTGVDVAIEPVREPCALRIVVSARTTGQTGVEMEALTAVQVGLLTLYDMVKALDPAMTIGPVHLLRKEGGRHGAWSRPGGSDG